MPAPAEICSGSPEDRETVGLKRASASGGSAPTYSANVRSFSKS